MLNGLQASPIDRFPEATGRAYADRGEPGHLREAHLEREDEKCEGRPEFQSSPVEPHVQTYLEQANRI